MYIWGATQKEVIAVSFWTFLLALVVCVEVSSCKSVQGGIYRYFGLLLIYTAPSHDCIGVFGYFPRKIENLDLNFFESIVASDYDLLFFLAKVSKTSV